MKKIDINLKEEISGGSVESFCVGWAAGVGLGLGIWGAAALGPVGISILVLGSGVCMAASKA